MRGEQLDVSEQLELWAVELQLSVAESVFERGALRAMGRHDAADVSTFDAAAARSRLDETRPWSGRSS